MHPGSRNRVPLSLEPLECRLALHGITFPADAGVLNVVDFGAVPDDGGDDTAAIQLALDTAGSGNRVVYLPDGTYDVSDQLTWPAPQRFLTLQGQSRDGTVLRLNDYNPEFQQPGKAVLSIPPGGSADRFQNEIRNLTVYTGVGNPGAAGIRFISNNQGGIFHVAVIAGDLQGDAGVVTAGLVGPTLFKDLFIYGFDYGLRTGNVANSVTAEGLQLWYQNVAGLFNVQQVVTVRGLVSVNAVPAVQNGNSATQSQSAFGVVNLIEAWLYYSGKDPAAAAIISHGWMYARDIFTEGYGRTLVLERRFGGTILDTVTDPYLDEYTSTRSVQSLFPSAPASLRLPVAETPDVPWDDPATWVNVLDYAAGDGVTEDTTAIEQAIDSMKPGGANYGKTTLYFPGGRSFRVAGVVNVSGPVHRLLGLKGRLVGSGGTAGFRILDSGAEDAPVVRFDRFSGFGRPNNFVLEHASARTVAVTSSSGVRLVGSGPGDFFVEDVVGPQHRFEHPGQRVWARQLNAEGTDPPAKVFQRGGDLWVLGIKSEQFGTVLETTDGGRSEVVGGLIYRVAPRNEDLNPIFRITHAAASFAGVAEYAGTLARDYANLVAETRDDATRTLPDTQTVAFRHNGSAVLLLYVGQPAAQPGFAWPPNPGLSLAVWVTDFLNNPRREQAWRVPG